MRATVTPIRRHRSGTYALVEAALPQRAQRAIGVILIDSDNDRAWFRVRPGFDDMAEPEDVEVLAGLQDYIETGIAAMGAGAFLQSLEESASNAIRVTDRQSVAVDAFSRVLERRYSEHVDTVPVQT